LVTRRVSFEVEHFKLSRRAANVFPFIPSGGLSEANTTGYGEIQFDPEGIAAYIAVIPAGICPSQAIRLDPNCQNWRIVEC